MAHIFKVVASASYNGQECQNRWWYFNTGGDGTADWLAEFFAEILLPAMATIQSSTLNYNYVAVTSLTGGGNAVIPLTTLVGQQGGDWTPSHDAFALGLISGIPGMRGGRKAIAGVPEIGQTSGDVNATFRIALDALAGAFAETIMDVAVEYVPILLRELVPQQSWVVWWIADGIFRRMSTQNTRKGYTNSGQVSFPMTGVYLSAPAPNYLGEDLSDFDGWSIGLKFPMTAAAALTWPRTIEV